MKGKVYIAGLMLLLSLSLLSCGGGGGAPGSSSRDTGIQIQSALLSDASNDNATVTMTITAVALNPGATFSPFPANIKFCSVTYTSAVIGAPIIESRTIYPNCSFSDGAATACTLEMLNIARKNQWCDDVVSGKFKPAENPTTYTVVYDCTYQNNFSEDGTLGGRIDIDLDSLSCGG